MQGAPAIKPTSSLDTRARREQRAHNVVAILPARPVQRRPASIVFRIPRRAAREQPCHARRVAAREAGAGDKVQVQIADELAAMAEPDLLARALANLVRNALRYAGDAGPVLITAEPVEQGVALRVSDSGPGVPAGALQKIFDPFYRLEASRSRDTGGVGLGLAIVKTCVEACQGSVAASNRQPSGLQVEIRLKA